MLRNAALAALVCAVALAETSEADKARARQHFEEGKILYNLGKFDDAVVEFEQAYRLFPDAQLLYNLARAHAAARNYEKAVFFYERYIAGYPNAEDRLEVERLIDQLKREQAKATAAAPPPAVAAAGPAPEAETRAETSPGSPALRVAGWITAGAGVALVGTGLYFGKLAADKAGEVEQAFLDGEIYHDTADARSAGERDEKIQIATLALGGAAVIAGAVMVWLGSPRGVQTAAVPARGGGAALVGGRF